MEKADLVRLFIRRILSGTAKKAKLERDLGLGPQLPGGYRFPDPDKK